MRNTRHLGALVALVAAAACTAPADDSLLLGSSRTVGSNSASGSSGSSSGPSGSTVSTGGGSGSSSGSSSGSGSGGTITTTLPDGGVVVTSADGGSAGRAMFEALLSTFESSCGPCHTQGTSNAPAYLGGADPYSTITAFPGIIVGSAGQSILLTKGAHEGPALADPLKTEITNWLTAEAANVSSGPAQTAPITVASGANTVDLSKLGVSGASLTFSAAISGNVLTLSSMMIKAPAATGVHVTYPIFYMNAGSSQIENDDMSDVDQTVGAGTSATLDTGLLILTGWATGDTLQIAFTKLATATVVDAGTGGCKNVASFTTNAVPAIQANTCLNCHNTGGSGNAALDLSGLGKTPADDTGACAQALSRINTTTPAQSDIILAPTGKVANHPFTSASANYVTMMETWIQAEK